MECKACELVSKGQEGITQDDHYGGCIPNWVETEDVWAILSKPLDMQEVIQETTRDMETLDIDSDMSD